MPRLQQNLRAHSLEHANLLSHKVFLRIAALIALSLMLGRASAYAQTLTEGALEGAIRDKDGNPILDAVVTLKDRVSQAQSAVPVTRNGEFSLPFVMPGEYDLTIEAFGARPLRLEAVIVRAGVATRVNAIVTSSEDPNAPLEVRRFAGSAGGGTQVVHASDLARFPDRGRTVSSVATLTTATTPTLETEGLPGWLSGLRIDGMATGQLGRRGRVASLLPLSSFRSAVLLQTNADVEWGGTATPALAVQTVTAGPRLDVKAFGDWISGAERTGDLSAPKFGGFRAGASLSGQLVPDTASFVLGVEVWQVENALSFGDRIDTAFARVSDIARSRYNLQNNAYVLDRLAKNEAISAFGRVDWRIGADHTLNVRGAVTSMPESRLSPFSLETIGTMPNGKAMDAYVAASLTSSLSSTIGQEFRFGWDRNNREYGVDANADFDQTSTLFLSEGLTLGTDPLQNGREQAQTFRLRETLHFWFGEHHFKAGFTADLPSYEIVFNSGDYNTFIFSDADAFAQGNAYRIQRSGLSTTTFKMPRYAAFLQDEWTLASRFRLLLGARWDAEVPPVDDLKLNEQWFLLSGIRGDSALTRRGRISPRVEFEWRPDIAGRWALRGSGGVWDAPMDPLLVGEVIANDGRIEVRSGFENVVSWPSAGVNASAQSLSLVAPAFQGPRSTRAALQLSRVLGAGVEFDLSGVYRRTELLPRRADLNLVPNALGTDQYGRPLYGVLQQQGSVIAAGGGSNRRFSDFDVVSAINVDGWSEYRGLNASLRAQIRDALHLQGRYTYSQTEDNWFMARNGGGMSAITPFPNATGADWTEGVSDFDVPHRALFGAELTLPVLYGLKVAGLYRYRSGYAFTPGFRAGVDMNGDGSFDNDPAFVDGNVPGFDEVAARFSCLSDQVNGFAARNSCRADAASFLDARASVGLYRSDRSSAELVIDVLNLVSSGGEEIDRALYLVDSNRTIVNGANTLVPLTINPQFGTPVLNTAPGRTLRIGLRVKY